MKKILFSLLLVPSISFAFIGSKELSKAETNEFFEKGFFNIDKAYNKEEAEHRLATRFIQSQMDQNYLKEKADAMKSKNPVDKVLVSRDVLPSYLEYHRYQNLNNISFYNSTDKTVKRLDIYFNNENEFNISDHEIWKYEYMSRKYWESRNKAENNNLSDNNIAEMILKEEKPKFIEMMKEKNKSVLISIEMDVKPHTVGNVNFLLPFKQFNYSAWFLEKVWVE
ncbi:hypothetical protein ACFGZ3_03450 [Pasteurella multocida]|nr:hypothetical protein [Pasteurella multocida]